MMRNGRLSCTEEHLSAIKRMVALLTGLAGAAGAGAAVCGACVVAVVVADDPVAAVVAGVVVEGAVWAFSDWSSYFQTRAVAFWNGFVTGVNPDSKEPEYGVTVSFTICFFASIFTGR